MSQELKSKELIKKNCARNKYDKYVLEKVIGFGMFGRVWRAKDKATLKYYAIKETSKAL